MKILSFGHIPTWAGGRQNQGLSNVIYNLSLYMSKTVDVEESLAATDVFYEKINRGKLSIYGWNKKQLIKFLLLHPFSCVIFLLKLILLKRQYPHTLNILGTFFKGIHLKRIINLIHPDIVHLHGAHSVVYLSVIPKNIKSVLTIHGAVGSDKNVEYNDEYEGYERYLCKSRRISKIYFIARNIVDEFANSYGPIIPSTEVILNSYNSDIFHYIAPKEHTKMHIGTVATIQPRKGQCRVLDGLRKSNLNVKYTCVGSASENEIKDLDIKDVDFEYIGKKTPSEIREYYSNIDYMILPSSSEGFGLVYLEAIACGVPVILPKHLPIVQEKGIIQPGVNALLLEDSSAEAIAKLLPTLKDYHFDHKKVSESIVGYSWENIAKEYVESFKEILNG